MRDRRSLVPCHAAIVRARHDLGKLLGLPPHQVRTHCETTIWEIKHAIRLKTKDPCDVRARPSIAVVIAPPHPIAGGLILVEMRVVIVIAQHG